MSKVYRFRLDEHNTREAQAKRVIHAWVKEGYSLRHVVVEALFSLANKDAGHSKLTEVNEVVDQLQNLILTKDKLPNLKFFDAILPNSFLDAVKKSARDGGEILTAIYQNNQNNRK